MDLRWNKASWNRLDFFYWFCVGYETSRSVNSKFQWLVAIHVTLWILTLYAIHRLLLYSQIPFAPCHPSSLLVLELYCLDLVFHEYTWNEKGIRRGLKLFRRSSSDQLLIVLLYKRWTTSSRSRSSKSEENISIRKAFTRLRWKINPGRNFLQWSRALWERTSVSSAHPRTHLDRRGSVKQSDDLD